MNATPGSLYDMISSPSGLSGGSVMMDVRGDPSPSAGSDRRIAQ
jgi:hypothetical protein